jgi:DNA-binding NtrC family response regulator
MKHKILIVEDNENMQTVLSDILESSGYEPVITGNGKDALKEIKSGIVNVVVLDYKLPGENGDVILNKIKNVNPGMPVIILTAYGDIKNAVESIKKGAFDYLTKPFNNDELINTIGKAVNSASLNKNENDFNAETECINPEDAIFNSSVMQNIMKQIKIVAPTEMTVLITGESGTGKEITALLIKNFSSRKEKQFITVDCGALTESLIESELFGHEKGAFTDAKTGKEGKFEIANGGTIFLDEISNLSDSSQVKLLRALEERKITRVGGNIQKELDVRIISATNSDLSEAIGSNKFRSDLFYRLNEFQIKLPSLRERKEDMPLFIRLFISYANKEMGKSVKGISDSVLKVILEYDWPGNIRELRNNIRRAVLLNEGDTIENTANFEFVHKKPENEFAKISYAESSMKAEKDIILNALISSGCNKTKASKLLNMNIRTLYRKIKKLNIEI